VRPRKGGDDSEDEDGPRVGASSAAAGTGRPPASEQVTGDADAPRTKASGEGDEDDGDDDWRGTDGVRYVCACVVGTLQG
jgi:hypothetical protein